MLGSRLGGFCGGIVRMGRDIDIDSMDGLQDSWVSSNWARLLERSIGYW